LVLDGVITRLSKNVDLLVQMPPLCCTCAQLQDPDMSN